MSTRPVSIGLDVGGAHLKVAATDENAVVQYVAQFPTPVWQGPGSLIEALESTIQCLRHQQIGLVGITMTAELVDYFQDRQTGVSEITSTLEQTLDRFQTRYFAGKKGFVTFDSVVNEHRHIASANWLATALYLMQRFEHGLLIDIGSTTTDIIPFSQHEVLARGENDHERLHYRELVYSGIVRTPVMAVTDHLRWHEGDCPVMNEQFATMADVYRITGEIPEGADQHATADGREKSVTASIRRLARMIGLEPADTGSDAADWQKAAVSVRAAQRAELTHAIEQVLAGLNTTRFDRANCSIIGAGCGRFLIREIANTLQLPYVDIAELFSCQLSLHERAADCAAAVAVAHLVGQIE